MTESSVSEFGDTLTQSPTVKVMSEMEEQRRKSKMPEGAELQPEQVAEIESPANKLRKHPAEEEFESLKRKFYNKKTMDVVNKLNQMLKLEAEAKRAAVIIDPEMKNKLTICVTVLKRLPESLKQRVSETMEGLGISQVDWDELGEHCTAFSRNCGVTQIWYVREGEQMPDPDSEENGALEVEMLFWQGKQRTGRNAVCIFPFHLMPIDDYPGNPGKCIDEYNKSSYKTKLLARNKENKARKLLKKPITLHDFSPSEEHPVPEGDHDHLHFAKDIIAAQFQNYNQANDKVSDLFNIPIQAEKVLKLDQNILLQMAAANVKVYVSNLEGYMTLPVIHGVKNYYRYLYVEFLLLNGELTTGQCGKVIYVKTRDGGDLKIGYFVARYLHTKGFERYKAAVLSANLEGLGQKLGLYKGDDDDSHEDIYEELDFPVTQESIKQQFLTKDDPDLETPSEEKNKK